MAIAVDQLNAGTAVDDAGGTSIGVTTNQNIASGGFIVVSIGCWSASASPLLSSVSASGLSVTGIAAQGKHQSQNWHVMIAWLQAPSGFASGGTITANFSESVNGRQIGISSFTGVDSSSSPVDVAGTQQSPGTAAWSTGALSILAGSLLIGTTHADGAGGGVTTSFTAGAQLLAAWGDGANNTVQASGYRIESSAGSYNVGGTWSPANVNVAIGAAFKASSAAPPQIILPDADIVTTGWSTAPLFSKVNDASDATVITATAS